MDPFHPIWTKFGRHILLNPRNKLTEEFLIYRKIQDGRHGRHYSKLRNRSWLEKYTSKKPNFFPRPMFSRVRNAMKLSFLFYDHSNYFKMAAIWVKRRNTYSRGVILLWELQIDMSIILLVFTLIFIVLSDFNIPIIFVLHFLH